MTKVLSYIYLINYSEEKQGFIHVTVLVFAATNHPRQKLTEGITNYVQ